MEALLWMFYSYSCLILSALCLMTSLFGPESALDIKEARLSTFFFYAFALIFVLLPGWFYFQSIFLTIVYFTAQVFGICFSKKSWSWYHIFLSVFCSLCPLPYFNVIYQNFGSLREKSLVRPIYVRYLNSVGATLNMSLGIALFYYQNDKSSLWSVMFFTFFSQSLIGIFVVLETKTDFGLYDSALQNAAGHAFASFGLSGRTWMTFAVCTVLAAGRFLLESRRIPAPGQSNLGTTTIPSADGDLEIPIMAEP